MNNAIGIVAEYNPFHNGHLLHIKKARALAGSVPVIAVISGSLVQRGEPAFASKWLRAQLAVLGGADLVLELPAVFSCRSAEFFARGAVQLLAATGQIAWLAFGAETADAETLMQAAAFTAQHSDELRALIKNGASYAAAQAQLLAQTGSGFVPDKANDILALEYCRCLLNLNSEIKPLAIRRSGAGYNSGDLNCGYASASALRAEYAANGLSAKILAHVPPKLHPVLQQAHAQGLLGYDKAALDTLVLYKLRSLTEAQLAAACECTEGLENRLKAAAAAPTMQAAVQQAVSKRYTASRIRRLLMQLLLDVDKTVFTNARPQYLRVLAFNDVGRSLLAGMRSTAALPVITKTGRNFANCLTGNAPTDALITQQLTIDVKAANLLALLQHPRHNAYNADFLQQPIYIRP